MINAKQNEILIGGSTSINLYVLSNALKKFISTGDEVIVTNQDHEANISPWRRLAEIGAKVIEWKINTKNGELEINDLEKLINKKTKILAVTHCSNIVGSVNDLKRISDIAHKHNIFVIGDGVSFAPHGFPNVKELGVDSEIQFTVISMEPPAQRPKGVMVDSVAELVRALRDRGLV